MLKKLVLFGSLSVVFGFGIILWIGGHLCAANPREVGPLPADLVGEAVLITSKSGSELRGWFMPGQNGAGTVILLHSLRGSRLNMLDRARFLARENFSVLLIDFQAHGESPGERVTFGYLESLDAQAAVRYVRERLPHERVGADGISLGGAAIILSDPPLELDAVVLESVYPTFEQAVADRLELNAGWWARGFQPVLTMQLRPRLGFGVDQLQPIACVGKVTAPKLIIAGTRDRHTPLAESQALFDGATEPKEFWAVEGAAHQDLYAYGPSEYERRVVSFLSPHLRH